MPRCRIRNVHCTVDSAVGRRRFLDRQQMRGTVPDNPSATSMRPGTFDWGVFAPLDLAVPRLLVDTTDGYDPSLDAIMAFCRA